VYQALSRLPERVSRGLIRATGRSVTLSRSVNSLNVAHAVERRNTVLPAILSEVDYIISPSECHRQVFDRSRIIGIEEIHYLAHGHNVERAAQGQEKVPSDKLRFGFTGNPSPHKGVRTLIEAWQKLKSPLNAELHIWGDLDSKGAFGQALKEMARNDPSIIFQGPFEHKDIGRILQSIDVVVVPSECIENSPLTIAEAFAAQTPVLGSDTCGVVEHIQPEIDGLLFKRGDASALARQMKRLIAELGPFKFLPAPRPGGL
jgi:glycosyltransferase involved in cell wall biosynthesis